MIDVPTLSTRDLLALYGSILDELIERKVVRSRNAPLGDVAETLVATAYDGQLAAASEKSWDVRAADGRLLQVKARLVTGGRRRGQYGVFRSWDFDACVFLLLDSATYDVIEAIEVPSAGVQLLARDVAWVGGARVRTAAPLGALDGAVEVTQSLRDAMRALPGPASTD